MAIKDTNDIRINRWCPKGTSGCVYIRVKGYPQMQLWAKQDDYAKIGQAVVQALQLNEARRRGILMPIVRSKK